MLDSLKDKPVFEKRPLVWEEDMQMHSKFLDRKVTKIICRVVSYIIL